MQSTVGAFRMAAILAAAGFLTLLSVACGSDDSNVQAAEESQRGRKAIAEYRSELGRNAALLVRAVQAMLPEIENGAIARAQSRYARARVRYGEVEPFASTFGELDLRIDGHDGEVATDQLGGFHRLEKALWDEGTTTGMTSVTRALIDDTKELEERFAMSPLPAIRIMAGAADVLAEVSSSTLAGMDERYSNTDLVDVAANVEGIEAAFDAAKPLVAAADEELPKEVEARIEELYATVGKYGTFARDPEQQRDRSPGVSWVIYSGLSQAEIDKIKRQVDALAQPLSEAQDQISES